MAQRVCCIQKKKKKKLLIFHMWEHFFAEDLLKINLLWLRLYVWGCNKLFGPHHEKTCFCHMWTTKAQFSLRIHAVWAAPLLFAALKVTRFTAQSYSSIHTRLTMYYIRPFQYDCKSRWLYVLVLVALRSVLVTGREYTCMFTFYTLPWRWTACKFQKQKKRR